MDALSSPRKSSNHSQGLIAASGQELFDPSHQPGEDVRDVLGPALPISAVAALLDDLGVDGAGRQVQRWERQCCRGCASRRARTVLAVAEPAATEDDAARRLAVEVDLVDLGVQPVVVGTQRPQHAPHNGESHVVVQRLHRVHALRDGHWQHDVAVLLALGLAHGAAHGLHDVHVRAARAHEQHGVERRHVDAFGEAAGIGKDAAGVVLFALQPFDAGLAVQRMVLSVHVLRFRAQRSPLLLLRQLLNRTRHHVVPVLDEALGGQDGVGEGNRPLERPSLRGGLGVLGILQRLPAADDLGGVGDVQFAVSAGQVRLQGRIHALFGESENNHFVVREQSLLDRLGERQAVEFGAVFGFVVHREDGRAVIGCLRLGAFRIEPRRGRHVEALLGANPFPFVDENERRCVVVRSLDAGGAVRLVAQDEIEARRTVPLRLLDHRQGVVGGEDHGHGVVALSAERSGHLVRRSGDRYLQFLQRGILVLPAGASVRTDADVAMRQLALACPFAHGLGEQGDGRHQVENATTGAGHSLGDAQGREGLAGAARHHQLAAVVGFEAGNHVVEGGLLVWPQAEGRMPQRQVLGVVSRQVGPVERTLRQVAEAQNGARRRLEASDRLAGVRPPLASRIHDDPAGEGLSVGRGEERIQMRLGDGRSRRVALALDGAVAAVALFGHQVDAGVRAVEARVARRPVGPQPHLVEPIPVHRVFGEELPHQPLEERTLLAFGLRNGAELVEGLVEGRGQGCRDGGQEVAIVHFCARARIG